MSKKRKRKLKRARKEIALLRENNASEASWANLYFCKWIEAERKLELAKAWMPEWAWKDDPKEDEAWKNL